MHTLAPRLLATSTAVGVASPRAHGHATTRTSTARRMDSRSALVAGSAASMAPLAHPGGSMWDMEAQEDMPSAKALGVRTSGYHWLPSRYLQGGGGVPRGKS